MRAEAKRMLKAMQTPDIRDAKRHRSRGTLNVEHLPQKGGLVLVWMVNSRNWSVWDADGGDWLNTMGALVRRRRFAHHGSALLCLYDEMQRRSMEQDAEVESLGLVSAQEVTAAEAVVPGALSAWLDERSAPEHVVGLHLSPLSNGLPAVMQKLDEITTWQKGTSASVRTVLNRNTDKLAALEADAAEGGQRVWDKLDSMQSDDAEARANMANHITNEAQSIVSNLCASLNAQHTAYVEALDKVGHLVQCAVVEEIRLQCKRQQVLLLALCHAQFGPEYTDRLMGLLGDNNAEE